MEAIATYSRTCFCPRCKERGSPQEKESVMLFGQTRVDYYLAHVYGGISGFTPHLVSFLQRDGKKNVILEFVCAIDGCGIDAIYNSAESKWDYEIIENKILSIPIKDFNAMVLNPDLGYWVT